MLIESLLEEALPSVSSSAQLFANCPQLANAAIVTLRSTSSACKGITLRRNGTATAGGNGIDIPLGTRVVPLDYTNALLMRAIENGGTVTGYIQYIRAAADIIAALAIMSEQKDRTAEITALLTSLLTADEEYEASAILTADGLAFNYPFLVTGILAFGCTALVLQLLDGGSGGTVVYGSTTALTGDKEYNLMSGIPCVTNAYFNNVSGTGSVVFLGKPLT